MPDFPKQPTQFTSDELSLRLECLKLAAMSQFSSGTISLCQDAQIIYDWITTGKDPIIEYVSEASKKKP